MLLPVISSIDFLFLTHRVPIVCSNHLWFPRWNCLFIIMKFPLKVRGNSYHVQYLTINITFHAFPCYTTDVIKNNHRLVQLYCKVNYNCLITWYMLNILWKFKTKYYFIWSHKNDTCKAAHSFNCNSSTFVNILLPSVLKNE